MMDKSHKITNLRNPVLAPVALVLFLFMIFIWPTKYRYDSITLHDLPNGSSLPIENFSDKNDRWNAYINNKRPANRGGTFPVRINRFTDSAERLIETGWVSMVSAAPVPRPAEK
jgi:hypothetical protein